MIRARAHILSPAARRRPIGRAGYSLIEILITVLIVQIISGLVAVNVSSVDASERLNRAASEVVASLRYARMVAMSSASTNTQAGVEFNPNPTQNYLRVFAGANKNTVTNPMMPGGVYYVALANQRETSAVRISSVNLAGASGQIQVVYNVMGSTNNNGYITLAYGSHTKTIYVPLVGDPRIQ